eukprot:gene10224-15721_t
MQVGKLNATLSLYNAMKHVFESEGWRALYRGLSMNWIKGPIVISVSFTANDKLKAMFQDRHARLEQEAETPPQQPSFTM